MEELCADIKVSDKSFWRLFIEDDYRVEKFEAVLVFWHLNGERILKITEAFNSRLKISSFV